MARVGLDRLEFLMERLKRELDMGTSTFVGAEHPVQYVRLENTASAVQNSDSEVTWTQPAGSVINNIWLGFSVAPVFSSGDFGLEVGTASGGGQIITQMADEIIDAGTTVVLGAVIHVASRGLAASGTGGPVLNAFNSATTDATSLAADGTYTASDRTLYFNTPLSNVSVTTAGTAVWIIEYMLLA